METVCFSETSPHGGTTQNNVEQGGKDDDIILLGFGAV
jgi:hypothetical protein